jgi:hypothetical protein
VALGCAQVRFSDAKRGVDETREVLYAAEISDGAVAVDWTSASKLDVPASSLARSVPGTPSFDDVPAAGLQPRSYAAWEKSFARFVAQGEALELFLHRDLGLTSRPNESERDFRIRVQDANRAERDAAVDAVRKKYATRQAQLADRRRRAEATVVREQEQASQAKMQTGVSMAATLFGALLGRKAISASTLGRATTVARGVGRSMKESGDIKRAGEGVEAVDEQIRALEEELQAETQRIAARFESEAPFETLALTPKRGQVAVQFVALGWLPADGGGRSE